MLTRLAIVSDPPCQADCTIGPWDQWPDVWGWYHENNPWGDGVVRYGVTTSITATVVTIVNTVLKTTSVTTLMPADYTPPPTNAAGTRVETITYTRGGKASTTVLYANSPLLFQLP